ncbi:MAG: hypothetical protein BWY25_02308 [Chloroflexi bacterium ADurb.Bin222]|nr:MAG: hypothetical protein BWY25_02308 [Chloroflexi bacterium ADurb.Bin222]
MQEHRDVALAEAQNRRELPVGHAAAEFQRDEVLLAAAELLQGLPGAAALFSLQQVLFRVRVERGQGNGSFERDRFTAPVLPVVGEDGVAGDAEEPRHERFGLPALVPGAQGVFKDRRRQILRGGSICHAISNVAVDLRQRGVVEGGEVG